jgi:hypothetical protein
MSILTKGYSTDDQKGPLRPKSVNRPTAVRISSAHAALEGRRPSLRRGIGWPHGQPRRDDLSAHSQSGGLDAKARHTLCDTLRRRGLCSQNRYMTGGGIPRHDGRNAGTYLWPSSPGPSRKRSWCVPPTPDHQRFTNDCHELNVNMRWWKIAKSQRNQ